MFSRPSSISLGFCGQAVRDSYLAAASIEVQADVLYVQLETRCWCFPMPGGVIAPGAKLSVAQIPASLLAVCEDVRLGGGTLNSLFAARAITQHTPFLYVDTALADTRLQTALEESGGVTSHFLGLRPLPENVVLGDRSDKLILKSPIQPAETLTATQVAALEALPRCPAVLLNSAKDPAVVGFLTDAARRHGSRLSVVLTPSLPGPFLIETLLPAASLLIANWDELGAVLDLPIHATLSDALRGIAGLRGHAPQADILLTLGKEGALACAAGDRAAYYIRLRRTVSEEVQRLVAQQPARTCGAGDAFAAGAFVDRESGQSLLAATDSLIPAPVVRWAMSGCATALRWLGYPRPLASSDFTLCCQRGKGDGDVVREEYPRCPSLASLAA